VTTSKIREYADSRPLATIFLISGVVGFSLGLTNATWQVTVESGQVLAGIVRYPSDNPFYMYHVKLFTIITQLSALLLRVIGSEQVVSLFISGLLGMISFQAIATLIFAVNRNIFISIMGVIFIYLTNQVGDGAVYPIWLLGHPHTYGILGLSFVVLTIALLGAKAYRAGLFCLAIAPCVHPSLGAWLVVIVCLSAAFKRDFAKQIIRAHYGYLIAGAIITILSLSYQLHLMGQLPAAPPEDKKMLIDAYTEYWGSHQQKLYWGYPTTSTHFKRWGVLFCMCSVIASFHCRRLFGKDNSLCFMFTVIMISGIASLLLGFLTQLPPRSVPLPLLMFMPGRHLNLNNITLTACMLGVLTFGRNRSYVTNFNVFAGLLAASFFSRHSEVNMITFGFFLWWIGFLVFRTGPAKRRAILLTTRPHGIAYEVLVVLFLVAYIPINIQWKKYVDHFLIGPRDFKSRTNNEFYSTIAEREGLLVITQTPMISLKTRRPILVDIASPNTITYAPQSAGAFNNILKKVYGLDLLVPPPPERRNREVLSEMYKDRWEQRSPAEWRAIRTEFAATDILTPEGWELLLPVVARGEQMILYGIPGE